jgi:hypothetical protein
MTATEEGLCSMELVFTENKYSFCTVVKELQLLQYRTEITETVLTY